jgi:hypothetical protein
MTKNIQVSKIIVLVIAGFVLLKAAIDFRKMHTPEELFPGDNLTKIGQLSDYFDGIKGTDGDTDIYFFDSGKEGATVFLAGGTHPNEPAGYIAAVVMLENIKVDKGRVIIIPRLNNSAFTCTDPMEAYPQFFEIETGVGVRKFRYGSRGTNPLHQWPDPLVFSQYPSGQQYSGFDSRNLNRCYPGRPNGSLTEKVAYSVLQFITTEKVDIAFDLHEAAPEIPIINAIVYHEKCEDIAMNSVFELEITGLSFSPELSPYNFHGLSHREWGDNTDAFPFLMETSNPIQGRLRGKTNSELILTGFSQNYLTAKETGALRIAYSDEGEVLENRVGRHISGFVALVNSFNELYPERAVVISGLPTYEEILENKVGAYLN